MQCIRCGLHQQGQEDYFICPDCNRFSPVVQEIFEMVENEIQSSSTVDPIVFPLFTLIADTSFVVANNPHLTIFYRFCEFLVSQALLREYTFYEEDLRKNIRTIKSWSDVLKIFSELNLIEVIQEPYTVRITITGKGRKLGEQFLDLPEGKTLANQTETRLSHIYGGYISLYLMYKLSLIQNYEEIRNLPYHQRPKSLWNNAMFLWTTAMENDSFKDNDLSEFLTKRGSTLSYIGRIIRQLQTLDSRTVQSLIKSANEEEGNIIFMYNDYALSALERVRENIRDRTR